MASEVGTVSELWRYPVQSLQGESLPVLEFTTQGVVGDRGYSIVDDTGEGGTAARPQWKTLIGWRARYLAEPQPGVGLPKVEITFDDGTQMISDDARLDGAISERLGRRGRLAVTTAPDVKRPYVASPCHLLTSATLKALSSAYPSGRFVSQRFRPNVTLDCGEAVGFLETDWIGRAFTVGALTMKGTEHCLRCALTTRPQGDLPKDPGILHTAQQHNENRVGIYTEVGSAGTLRIGDPAILQGTPIVLASYDPEWSAQFAAAKATMMEACGGLMLDVHHVGSTSVPGLIAKPIIDMMPVLRRHEDGLACIAPMQALGYVYRGERGIAGRHLFVRGNPRSHNIHAFAAGNPEIDRHLLFRDYLRAHPEERDAYARLKQSLAEKLGDDLREYAEAKTPFCERIDRLARAARA